MGGKLKLSIVAIVLEGLLCGCNFLVLFKVLDLIFGTGVSFDDILHATGILSAIFFLRLVIYMTAYTGSQIGGSEVSQKIRIAIGDKLKNIPLSLFTKNRTGFYINAATSEVGDYEQILTHKLAEITKCSILLLSVGIYSCTLYLPVGLATLASSLLLIPSVALSIHQVHIHGTKKNLAREVNVSAITEYLAGSQTLRSYALVGKKNEAVTQAMKTIPTSATTTKEQSYPLASASIIVVLLRWLLQLFLRYMHGVWAHSPLHSWCCSSYFLFL